MTASQTIKKCGLKSTKQVADLNDVTSRTIQLAYKSNRAKFYRYVSNAVNALNKQAMSNLFAVMDADLTTNKG
jgi:hypothetical protein